MTAFRPCKASSTQWVEQLPLGLNTPALPAPWSAAQWPHCLSLRLVVLFLRHTPLYVFVSAVFHFSLLPFTRVSILLCQFFTLQWKTKNGRESCSGSEPDFRQVSTGSTVAHCCALEWPQLSQSWLTAASLQTVACSTPITCSSEVLSTSGVLPWLPVDDYLNRSFKFFPGDFKRLLFLILNFYLFNEWNLPGVTQHRFLFLCFFMARLFV